MTRTQLWRSSSETFSDSGMRANSSCHDGWARSAGRPAASQQARQEVAQQKRFIVKTKVAPGAPGFAPRSAPGSRASGQSPPAGATAAPPRGRGRRGRGGLPGRVHGLAILPEVARAATGFARARPAAGPSIPGPARTMARPAAARPPGLGRQKPIGLRQIRPVSMHKSIVSGRDALHAGGGRAQFQFQQMEQPLLGFAQAIVGGVQFREPPRGRRPFLRAGGRGRDRDEAGRKFPERPP